MSENSQLLLRHILEGPVPANVAKDDSDDRDNFKKLRAAYDSCLDEEAIKKAGLDPLRKFLDEIKQKVFRPFSDDGLIGNATLYLAKYGIHPFVAAGPGADDKDPDVVVVSVSPPWTFGLPSKERYEDSKLLGKYRDIVVKVYTSIYPKEDEKTVAKVIDLEKRLAAASPSVEEREDVTVSRSLICAPGHKADILGISENIQSYECRRRL
jgi:endothelin-converting enzyme